MDSSIEDYIIKYIFNRVSLPVDFESEADKRAIKLQNYRLVCPKIERKNEPLKEKILDYSISYFRYDTKISLKKEENELILSYDLIGEVFDHLTLQTEKSQSFDMNDIEVFVPTLDMKIYDFFQKLKEYIPMEYKKINNHPFAVGISHDIDRTGDSYRYRLITHFFQTIKQKRPALLFKGMFGKNEEFNFEEILDIEKSFNARSTWFVLSQYGLKKNADYKLTSKWYKKAIQLLEESNAEIGLHIPFMDLSVDAINTEFTKLPKSSSTGVRMHHLRGDYQELMQLFDMSSVSYDSTFGFNEIISYRFGTSMPFHPIIKENENTKLLRNVTEIPLNIMDIQITNIEKISTQIKDLFNVLEQTGGVCVINWHNNRFNKTKYGSLWTDSYKLILEEARKRNAYLGPLNEIVKFFQF